MPFILSKYKTPFLFLTGGRGTGKTYGALKYVIEEKKKFVFMRRTQTEIDEIFNDEMNPFKSLNTDFGWNIYPNKISKSISGFYESADSGEGWKPCGSMKGLVVALSTIANIRGFDASDSEILVYDEFIPEKHKKLIRGEADAFFNAYETINRNRELKGQKAMRVLALSNSNDIANPIFIELDIVNKIAEMAERGQEVYVDSGRGLTVILLQESPISLKKSTTALYKLTVGSSFASMAIQNRFENPSHARIESRNLKEYKSILQIGELCIYEHKIRAELYVSRHASGTCEELKTSPTDRLKLRRFYNWIWTAYFGNRVIFESLILEILFIKYFTEKQ